jgi:hypothetical protein
MIMKANLEEFPLRGEFFWALCAARPLGNCLPSICFALYSYIHIDTQRPLQIGSKKSWLQPELVTDLPIVHVMLVLQVYKMEVFMVESKQLLQVRVPLRQHLRR